MEERVSKGTDVGAVPLLLCALVDDAALFPPGNAPMAEAVGAHRSMEAHRYAGLVGPFLCPASRLGELAEHLEGGDRLALGLIVDTGRETLHEQVSVTRTDDRFDLRMVEVPLPGEGDLAAAADEIVGQAGPAARLFVEVPRARGWKAALDVLAAGGQAAKFRTGGLRPQLFPAPSELAALIVACAERRLPFKCTAGLHGAVRHDDPTTGFRHHGFLNILVAAGRAAQGEGLAAVEATLQETDGERIAAAVHALEEPGAASDARRLFVSYGSCSVTEPIGHLEALGLLPGPG